MPFDSDSTWVQRWFVPPSEKDKQVYKLRYSMFIELLFAVIITPILIVHLYNYKDRVVCLGRELSYPNTVAGTAACDTDCNMSCYNITNEQLAAIYISIACLSAMGLNAFLVTFWISFGDDLPFRHTWSIPTGIVTLTCMIGMFISGAFIITWARTEPDTKSATITQFIGVALLVASFLLSFPAFTILKLYEAWKSPSYLPVPSSAGGGGGRR